MSRFVLRSKESPKLPDQKDKLKSPSNVLRTPSKKGGDNRKIRNTINSKDLSSVKEVPCPTIKTPTENENEDEDEKNPNPKISIICSLPLSRLTGIIEKLNIKSPSKFINNLNPTENANGNNADISEYDDIKEKEKEQQNQDENQSLAEDDTSNSKSQDQLLVKILCLYCDKKFSTHKMQQKHIEKSHTPLKDRRCSVRNSQVLQTTSPRNKSAGRQLDRASVSSSSNSAASSSALTTTTTTTYFPGCSYCKKTKSLESTDSSAIDFNGLFLHLTERHADKYFGCKICVMRFQNVAKLLKHMQNVHNTLPDAQLKLAKNYNNDMLDETNIETPVPSPVQRHNTRTKHRLSVLDEPPSVIGAEEAILSRLGLTQNRRRNPSNRKGLRLRRDTSVSDVLLKTETIPSSSGTTTPNLVGTSSLSSSLKSRNRATAKSTNPNSDADSGIFRVPVRTADSQLQNFDESFYKDVTSNVRNNLLYHLDGKLGDHHRSHASDEQDEPADKYLDKSLPLLLRGTLALASNNVAIQQQENRDRNVDSNFQESEIHVATNIPAITAFPTLLTTEQYCVDVTSAKIRRPHTKHSWKWKWDSVKKYKLINEGGKFVKKAKHPMLGLRDLSKLDMWTQLSMRQKHEKQIYLMQDNTTTTNAEECFIKEKRRLNDQLNSILDTRVLPHIILEQSEQAIIKVENDDVYERHGDDGDDFFNGNIVGQTFADEGFLNLLQLLPKNDIRHAERSLVLSGEWARPRCYLCMCCGNKFEKLKSLEEHKMFRHSNILSTHYEVVGRELLAGNILQHLFIPKRALSIYSKDNSNALMGGNSKSLISYRRVNTSAEEESSDSIQSITNCYTVAQHMYSSSLKHHANSSTTDDCDTDTKTTLLGDINTISPSHSSSQSTFSSSVTPTSNLSQSLQKENKDSNERKWKCSKCNRKCNSMQDLYRHMLDCSGDYVWSMVKKRKYRYYCGSKKRRPLHKQNSFESRRTKQEKTIKPASVENCTTEESNSNSSKTKTPPKPRPSDAESIKKMLENLPPKRICKKIFPTVSKTIKTRKRNFITKLYNTKVLRKTRARQISNAAKRAANNRFSGKSQIKNKALKTLRHKATNKNAQDRPKPSANVQVNSKNSQSEKRNSPKKDFNLEEQKQESKNSEDLVPKSIGESKASKIQEKQLEVNETENSEQKDIEKSEVKLQNKREIKETKEATDKKDATPPPTPPQTSETIETVENAKDKDTPKTKQIENQTFVRKRSKRISDCIAMLTGKLEEKLKTESTVCTKIDEIINDGDTTKGTGASIEQEKQKKTPKRKAVCRRIIKPDLNDTASSEIEQPTKNVVIPTTVPPILTTTVTTSKRATATRQTVAAAAVAPETKTTTTVVPKASPITSISLTKITPTIAKAKTKPIPMLPVSVAAAVAAPMPMPTSVKITPATATANATTNLVITGAVTQPTLVSIPIPIPPSALHGVPVPLKVLQNQLPVLLPVQQNISTPIRPPAPPIPLVIANNAAATPSVGVMASVALLPPPPPPPPPPLLQAHISPAVTTTVSSNLCSMEPLNLSSVKGPKKQTTAELRAQRPGMPARRQTICGFEARQLICFNDMEPLDLSKKSKDSFASIQKLPLPTVSLPPPTAAAATTAVAAVLAPPQQQPLTPVQIAHQYVPSVMPPPVDLLATSQATHIIPQNPSVSTRIQVDESSSTKPVNMIISQTLPPPETVFNKQFYSNLELLKIPQIRAAGFIPVNIPTNETFNAIVNNGVNVNICTNTTNPAPVQQPVPPKTTNNKKRNNSKVNNEQTATITTAHNNNNNKKEHTPTNKKDSAAKNKPIQKMDEEVINHIDDAINSVINAVKESLPENNEEKLVTSNFSTKTSCAPMLDTTNLIATAILDMEKRGEEPMVNKTPLIIPEAPPIVLTPKKRTLRSKTLDCRSELARITSDSPTPIFQTNVHETISNKIPVEKDSKIIIPLENNKEDDEKKDKTLSELTVDMAKKSKETCKKSEEKMVRNEIKENAPAAAISMDSEKETTTTTVSTINTANAIEKKIPREPTSLQESNVNLTASEDNMSNINNTSSGFHSSGTPENAGDVKKKQRRRRKNELAAIVADQLLESFKIDKARRDSLKKLENLAYEKSEDLLITGMLLMSSTKRNAASGISFTQNTNEKRIDSSTKRQKQESTAVTVQQTPKTRSKSHENSKKATIADDDIDVNADADANADECIPRKSKRRQSRRKLTPLDNENLSKLKSSLESFSIGIEKQLSEIEARNTNVFNNANDNNKGRKNSEQTPMKANSSILRPSILSATLEQQVDTQKNNAVTTEANSKAPTFSRDPRLNKNIHKDEQQQQQQQQTTILSKEKNITTTTPELEDDNYLTEIAKNVNEKIMSAENEDFAFADDDGFEIGNEFQDDSNSKFSRPPTSMSVRSAPNFNDDRSNFGSICDENTNTEVMDMDLDDEMSVYTSFSQDLGRGRGRKRRRRRSILLKRRPKKRRASQDLTAEKFECELCKKTFFAATSLAKHNMTLAHVSKVSEQEYLMSKSNMDMAAATFEDKLKTKPSAKPNSSTQSAVAVNQFLKEAYVEPIDEKIIETGPKELPNEVNNVDTSHRLSLNPDERLFFECCNILKSADTSRVVRGDNDYNNQTSSCILDGRATAVVNDSNLNLLQKSIFEEKSNTKTGNAAKIQETFRNPNAMINNFNKHSSATFTAIERQAPSPTYTQFSAVTNTTSRFKTKAAMKGYENGNIHVTYPEESKSRATCKLTELADIALGHDDKPRTPGTAVPNLEQAIIGAAKRVVTPEYVTLSVVDSRRNCNYNPIPDHNNKPNNETQGSSSSRTIMHSSIIKAAVEEHSKPQPVNKIIIPERPFKNIGLEEKESITFQKPKTSVNLLLDDNNSLSTASYSDRDDFDFGSMSCEDEEASDKTTNDKNLKSNSSDSSSSRATAKTFENKSLIMGRIFKNASTKPKAPVKNIGIQKDHHHLPKADLNQLFDELRAEGAPKPKPIETPIRPIIDAYQEPKIPLTVIPSPEPKRKPPKPQPLQKKPKTNKKSQKDFTKLQSELGMSQEEIEKLIDDGQRKSKRRCATNRSKKLVEMWSSDEYEEFLSTKDIIALIEEKEKQEQRRKRKNTGTAATNMEAEKGKEIATPTTTTSTINNDITTRKPSRSHLKAEGNKKEEKNKTASAAKSSTKSQNVLVNDSSTTKLNTWMKPPEDSTNTSKASKTKKVKNTRQTSSNKSHKNRTVTKKGKVTEETLDDPHVSEDNICLLDIKQNQINNNNRTTSRNSKSKKDHKSAKDDVNSFKSQARETNNKDMMTDLKKRNPIGNNNNNNNNNNKKNKSKRKPQKEKSPTRKRQASEKLYYWSSSSDEDFGRINDDHGPEFENTEQYQKHGWIVGDSHKKLVTLLAIAKGNKKVESCGVKKNVSKRKT